MQFNVLLEQVLQQRERDGVRGFDRELSRARCHIRTASFAAMDLADIRPRHIRSWLRDDMAQKEAKGYGPKRKLTRQTISRSLSLVSAVFVEAVERDIIEINPCLGVKSKKRVDESDTRSKWAYLTLAEQQQLFACESIAYWKRLVLRVSIGTGMRQGELRHLELPDLIVDGDDPHVFVRFAGRRKKTGEKLPPKSGRTRKITLAGDALVAAREWLEQLSEFAPTNPEHLVFPRQDGKRWEQGKMFGSSSATRELYAEAGIALRPHLHWHAQRHTFASNLVRLGVALPVIQKLMGHSSVTITERYAHLGEDAVAIAVRETFAADAAAIEVPAINEVIEVAPPPAAAAIVVRDPEPVRVVEERSRISRFVGRLFGRSKEASHVA